MVALVFGLVAWVSRRSGSSGRGRMPGVLVAPLGAAHPQDYRDLLRLVRTLRALELREPGRQAIRDALLAKLAPLTHDPSLLP